MLTILKDLFNAANEKIKDLFLDNEVYELDTEEDMIEVTPEESDINKTNYIRQNEDLERVFLNRQKNSFNELVVNHYNTIIGR